MELRVVDANLNRLGEALRVLEDVARLLLDDAALTERLKALRHRLIEGLAVRDRELLSARRAAEDVGAAPVPQERASLASLVVANSRRAQESLRVLEEFAKLPGSPLKAEVLQAARFDCYEIEKALVSRLLRQEKAARLRGLYVIIDPQFTRGRPEVEVARAAIAGGAAVIQLRDKEREMGIQLAVARQLKALCAPAGVLFLVNDHVDLALAAGADGVHVGQKDLPIKEVRRLLPVDMLAGCSANTPQEARRAQEDGADYVGVGAIFATQTKAVTRPASLGRIREVKAAITIPIVAIGGIKAENIAAVMAAGADGAAVVTAVVAADDVEAATRLLVARLSPEKG